MPGSVLEGPRPLAYHVVRGRRVAIRRARPEDRDKMIRFYNRLSAETLYNRFMSIIRYFDSYVDKLLSGSRTLVLVAEDVETGEIVGVAEAVGDESGGAECGIAILEDYQGAGLGTAMGRVFLEEARREGFKKLYAYILAGNVAPLKLARRFGARITGRHGDMLRAELVIRAEG